MDLQRIGACLRDLRKEKGLTQEQLAERFNISQRTVSRWKTGTATPDLDVLLQLADFYEVDLRALMNGEVKSTQTSQEVKEIVQKAAAYNRENEKKGKRMMKWIFVILIHFITSLIVQNIAIVHIIWHYDISQQSDMVYIIIVFVSISFDFLMVYWLMRDAHFTVKKSIFYHFFDVILAIPAIIILIKDVIRLLGGANMDPQLGLFYVMIVVADLLILTERTIVTIRSSRKA